MRGTVPPPRHDSAPYRICFVCTGNICRSPMAEVATRHLAEGITIASGSLGARLEISSAGTGNWHEGEPMDPRTREALEAAGYRDHGHVAHQFNRSRVGELDLLVALDRRHFQTLRSLGGDRLEPDRLVLLRSFDRSGSGQLDVPDPYYGDEAEFDQCLALIEASCRGLVDALVPVLESSNSGHSR